MHTSRAWELSKSWFKTGLENQKKEEKEWDFSWKTG